MEPGVVAHGLYKFLDTFAGFSFLPSRPLTSFLAERPWPWHGTDYRALVQIVCFMIFFLCFFSGVVWSRNCRIGKRLLFIYRDDDEWEKRWRVCKRIPSDLFIIFVNINYSSQFAKIMSFFA